MRNEMAVLKDKVTELEQENAMLRSMVRKHTKEIEQMKDDIELLNASLNIFTEGVNNGTDNKRAD